MRAIDYLVREEIAATFHANAEDMLGAFEEDCCDEDEAYHRGRAEGYRDGIAYLLAAR